MKPIPIYEEKVLKCSDCNGVVDKCNDCRRKFHKTSSVYCVLHTTVDDWNYIHLCENCAVKEKNEVL